MSVWRFEVSKQYYPGTDAMLACMLQRSGMQPVATAGMQAAIRFGEEEGRVSSDGGGTGV